MPAARSRAVLATVATVVTVVAASGATAAVSRVPLGKAAVSYDTAVWRATPIGTDAVTFTCIASDCGGQPRVFASLSSVREISADLANARRDGRVIRDDGVPSLPFEARTFFSGCRAKDTPILFAGGQLAGETYRFITAITAGCNFAAPLPDTRFLELLRGLEY